MRGAPKTTQTAKWPASSYEGLREQLKLKNGQRVVMRGTPRTTQTEKQAASCYERR